MLTWAIKKVFGTSHERAIRKMKPRVDAINALEEKMKALSDADLKAKTAEFREKIDNGATIDDLLVEAFAVCREASTTTSSSSAAWCSTAGVSPRCAPARAKRWWRPSPAT
jgi:preprotein translocase subunit SecA